MRLSHLEIQRLRQGTPPTKEQMETLLDFYVVWGEVEGEPEDYVFDESPADIFKKGADKMRQAVDGLLADHSDKIRQKLQEIELH